MTYDAERLAEALEQQAEEFWSESSEDEFTFRNVSLAAAKALRALDYELNERDDWCRTHHAVARRGRYYHDRCSAAANLQQGCVMVRPMDEALAAYEPLAKLLLEEEP